MRRPRVVDFVDRAEIPLVDPANVTQRMYGVRTVRVVARQAGIDFHAFELVQVDRKPSHLGIVEIEP